MDGIVVDSEGNLYDAFGKPLLSPDGKELKLLDGIIVDSDGFVYDASGKPMLSCDGKRLKFTNGMYVDESGMLYDNEGNPILGPDGKQCRLVDGKILDSSGNPLLGADGGPLQFVNGKLVSGSMVSAVSNESNSPSQARRCSTVSGFPPEIELSSILALAKMGADGKPMLGPNGELLDANGFPILGPNGELLGADGKPILGADGQPLTRVCELLDILDENYILTTLFGHSQICMKAKKARLNLQQCRKTFYVGARKYQNLRTLKNLHPSRSRNLT